MAIRGSFPAPRRERSTSEVDILFNVFRGCELRTKIAF